jgi:LysR family transcriptional regulator, glycine cleavage system transcriptional activator
VSARLPPLNALRAFEAAGRNRSFAKAAAELNVTPGAISRQIHTLEQFVGCPLFKRSHREVRLTSDASIYLETVTDMFRQVERATDRLTDSRKRRLLHIHAAITYTLRWLVPRLAGFHARYPKNEIRLSASLLSDSELHAAPTDVTIRISNAEKAAAGEPALLAHRLVDIELIPVCTAQYRDLHKLGGSPQSLRGTTLLHSSMRPNDWTAWFASTGTTGIDPRSGIDFESSSLAYQGALEGIGVAIAMRAFIETDLSAGRLVAPFEWGLSDGSAFYLTYSRAAAALPQVQEFKNWVVAEASGQGTAQQLTGGRPSRLMNPLPALETA